MKSQTILAMSIAALCWTACSHDETPTSAAEIFGNYEGYTLADCAYFQHTCTADETVTVTENADGSANVLFVSGSWGEFTVPNAQIGKTGDTYTLTGSGQTKMGMGGNVSSYDCTYTAVIHSREKAQMQFRVAGVMGGLTVGFTTGEAPADLLLAGTYEGYTDASCAYFQNRCTNDESLKITADGDGNLAVVFESATWGTFRTEKAAVTKSGAEYAFAGEGTVSMGMGDNLTDYAFTVTGTTDAAKESYSFVFDVPAVMGGLTVALLPGTAPVAAE